MSSSSKKKERRRLRYERNVKKEAEYKEKAWAEGKLLKPNVGEGPFPPDYSVELGTRLVERIKGRFIIAKEDNQAFIQGFRLYRQKIQEFILKYSPLIPKTKEYLFLKLLLETYWDKPENLYETAKKFGV